MDVTILFLFMDTKAQIDCSENLTELENSHAGVCSQTLGPAVVTTGLCVELLFQNVQVVLLAFCSL